MQTARKRHARTRYAQPCAAHRPAQRRSPGCPGARDASRRGPQSCCEISVLWGVLDPSRTPGWRWNPVPVRQSCGESPPESDGGRVLTGQTEQQIFAGVVFMPQMLPLCGGALPPPPRRERDVLCAIRPPRIRIVRRDRCRHTGPPAGTAGAGRHLATKPEGGAHER